MILRIFSSLLLFGGSVSNVHSAAIRDVAMYKYKLVCGADVEIESPLGFTGKRQSSKMNGYLRIYDTLHPEDAVVIFGFLKELNSGVYIVKVMQDELPSLSELKKDWEPAVHQRILGQFTVRSDPAGTPIYLTARKTSLSSILGQRLVVESLTGAGASSGSGFIREKEKFPCP